MTAPAATAAARSQLPTELVGLSSEQGALVEMAGRFAAEEIRPIARAVDESDTEVPWELWRKAASVGLTSFMLPAEVGGGGALDLFTQCLIQEELCVGDLALGELVTSAGFFAGPILQLGTADQQHRWLEPLSLADPPLAAVAVTEPDHGSDAAAIATRAAREAGGYRLSGEKAWISNGGVADFYVVFATVDPSRRGRGVTAFALERDAPGVSFGPAMAKMGARGIVNCSVHLDGAWVPDCDRLGEEGGGFTGLMRVFEASRVLAGAAAVGLCRAATDFALDYARSRRQFGRPIIEHQAIAFRLADMATRTEASRLLVWRAARRLDAGLPCAMESSMAKVFASESAMWVTWAAVQVMGGWGYSREFPTEKWMRDAKLGEIVEGTSDIQRLVISRALTNR